MNRRLLMPFFVLLVLSNLLISAETVKCLSCHESITPGIVEQWKKSRHAEEGISCYVCHGAKDDDPSGFQHYGVRVTSVVSPLYCSTCHEKEYVEFQRSKHAWTAFIGPLYPYYKKAKDMGLDPMSQETARSLNPMEMARRTVSPLFPDSGLLKKLGFLDDPDYAHGNVVIGCMECHGSFVVVDENGKLEGWPNTGVGRVNPDGSLGSCSSCHTRHEFSKAQARKPETCGQCHLGPDHPQMEIYEESKHGNIYASSGEEWNWDAPSREFGTDDVLAPTCAVCHMSGFNNAVNLTHDVGERLYWELQPKLSVPQWKGPEEVDVVLERIPDVEKAREGRKKMMQVCNQCHVSSWTEAYFEEFDKIVNDYNMIWKYTDSLLQQAYSEGLVSREYPLDEVAEVMHYLIWHHDGRRWRMGAAMMGPDWAHWNGAIDTIMIKLNLMIDSIDTKRKLTELENK